MKFVSPVCAPKEPHPLVLPGSDLKLGGKIMSTIFEEYAKYRYKPDEEELEEIEQAEQMEIELKRDLDEMEAYRKEQAEKKKNGIKEEPKDESQMTPEEKERAERLYDNRKLMRWKKGDREGYVNGGLFSPYFIQQTRMRQVVFYCTKQIDTWGPDFPEDPDICDKFPAIDPMGCFCEVDLGFKDRLSKIEAAAKTRPEEIQKYVEQVRTGMDDWDTKVGKVWNLVREGARRVQINTRAAKCAMTQEDSDWFLAEKEDAIKDTPSFRGFNKLLNVIEYAVGLSDRVPNREEREEAEKYGLPLTPELEAKRDDPVRVPDGIKVEFQDFSHKMEQLQFCKPENWGKESKNVSKDAPSSEEAEHYLEKYVEATADRYITPLFVQAERATNGIINRGDLIIVGGRTVSEIMEEIYREGIQKGTIGKGVMESEWYKENLNRMTGEIMSAGFMAGKRVEAFVPDKEGRIPKEPIGLTKSGYEPSPLEKVTLNAWERHFARYGHFEKKAAKAVDYQQTMEARERLELRNAQKKIEADSLAGPRMKEMFFGEWMKDNGALPHEVPGEFSASRSVFSTMAICSMVSKGYSLEDVLDPSKLVDVRNEIGKEVIEKMTAGDKEWEANMFFHGGHALAKEFDRIASSMDYTNEKELFSDKARPLFIASTAMMDVRQDMRKEFIEKEMLQAAEAANPGKGKEELERLDNLGKGLGLYVRGARDCLESRIHFERNIGESMSNIATWEGMKNVMAEKRSANLGKPQMELFGIMEMASVRHLVVSNAQFQNFLDMAEQKPEYTQMLAKKAITGELGQSMRIKTDSKQMKAEFGIEVKNDAKRTKKDERLREVVSKTTAKKAREQRDKEREAAWNALQKQAPKGPSRGRK